MSLVFTMPGKLGDALLQWPVAHWYCKENKTRCTLWLDENTLKPLKPLFDTQPCVEKVEMKSGIQNWNMGGQPWDFGLKTADHLEHEIYHLGMRKFPARQITLETFEHVPLNIDAEMLGKAPCLVRDACGLNDRRRLVLHGNFISHTSGVPGFWRFLSDVREDLEGLFSEIVFVGTAAERKRALELYPAWSDFDDEGNFSKLAELIDHSTAVIGCGSCVAALGGLLATPTIRVHDPIGEHPKVIWSNLGENQLNATERELRKEWPAFRDRWLAPATSAA